MWAMEKGVDRCKKRMDQRRSLFQEKGCTPPPERPSVCERIFWVVFTIQTLVLLAAGVAGIVACIRLIALVERTEVVILRQSRQFYEEVLSPVGRDYADRSVNYLVDSLEAVPVDAWSFLVGNVTSLFDTLSSVNSTSVTSFLTAVVDDPAVKEHVYGLFRDIHKFRGLGVYAARAIHRFGGDAGPICELMEESICEAHRGTCRWDSDSCNTL